MTIITEQGDTVIVENITTIPLPLSTTLQINRTDALNLSYTYANNALAVQARNRIQAAINSGKSFFNLQVNSANNPTFVSATPNAGVTPGSSITITGLKLTPTMLVFIGGVKCFSAWLGGGAQISISVVAPNLAGSTTYDLTIYDPATGSSLLEAGAITYAASGLSWSTITPSTMAAGGFNPAFVVAGTGFNAARINVMKLDDGASHSAAFLPFLISDTEIDLDADVMTNVIAATYTLYYSTTGGEPWTTTGLTVVAS